MWLIRWLIRWLMRWLGEAAEVYLSSFAQMTHAPKSCFWFWPMADSGQVQTTQTASSAHQPPASICQSPQAPMLASEELALRPKTIAAAVIKPWRPWAISFGLLSLPSIYSLFPRRRLRKRSCFHAVSASPATADELSLNSGSWHSRKAACYSRPLCYFHTTRKNSCPTLLDAQFPQISRETRLGCNVSLTS